MADGGWDESAHPRGPDGRFGGGGGPAGTKTWAAARVAGSPYRESAKQAVARSDVQAWASARAAVKNAPRPKSEKAVQPRQWVGGEHPDGPHADNTMAGRLVGKKDTTFEEHFTPAGRPTPERAAMHEREFIKPAFEGKKTAKELGMKPVAILTMGGPASGKGTVLSQLEKHGLDKSLFVHVDPDEVKGNLPEYKASVPDHVKGTGGIHGNGTGPTFKGAAAQVHEESSYVAKQIENRAIANGHNVIIDGTGGNPDSFLAKVDKLKNAGYHVEVHYPHLDSATGVQRAEARAEGSGRYVPKEVIQQTYRKIEAARDRVMAAVPNLTVYDGQNGHAVAYEKKNGVAPAHGRSPMEAISAARKGVTLRAK